MTLIESSWDDGFILDLRLAKLLEKYNIPAIFYIPNKHQKISRNEALTDTEIVNLSDRGFIIGGHTYSHIQSMKGLSKEQIFFEINENKHWLESITGKEIIHFCPPGGKFSQEMVDIAMILGFKYLRTTNVMNTDIPTDDMYQVTTIHVRPDRKEYKGKGWDWVAKQKLLEAISKGENGYYHIWGHSKEIEQFKLWYQLEAVFEFIKEKASL